MNVKQHELHLQRTTLQNPSGHVNDLP